LALILVSFVGGLDLLGTTLAYQSLASWSDRLTGSVTVATAGHGLEGADAAAARTVELLARTPGVRRAWLLDPDPSDALAARILGVEGSDPDATPPRLIGAVFEDASPLTVARLAALLRGARINGAVDDHGAWSGPLERAVRVAGAGAAAVALFALAGFFGLTTLGVRRSFARLRARVTLLIHLGAKEPDIVGPFSRRLALTAVIAAALGAAMAAGVAAALAESSDFAAWLKALGAAPPRLDTVTFGSAFLWCLAAWPTGILAAALAARSTLRALS
jgi:cell division protein FtsX